MLPKSRCSPAAVTSDSEIRAGWGWKNQRELILYFATRLDHNCSNFSSKEQFWLLFTLFLILFQGPVTVFYWSWSSDDCSHSCGWSGYSQVCWNSNSDEKSVLCELCISCILYCEFIFLQWVIAPDFSPWTPHSWQRYNSKFQSFYKPGILLVVEFKFYIFIYLIIGNSWAIEK